MNTRELAIELRKQAILLDSKPVIDIEGGVYISKTPTPRLQLNFYSKESFLKAAKNFGNTKKDTTEGTYAEFHLISNDGPVMLSVLRDKVCKQTVVYDCEPLFSTEEVDAL